MLGALMKCAHQAEEGRCFEVCANNPSYHVEARRAEAAIISGRASHEQWMAYAQLFESQYKFEKAEVCARYALLGLSGFGVQTQYLKPALSKLIRYRLRSKHLEGTHPLRIRAALEDATEALYGLFREMPERDKVVAKSTFQNLRDSLTRAITLTAYSGAEATAKLARVLRGSNPWNPSRLNMPELALDICLKELERDPEDPDLLFASASVCNDLEMWRDAIKYADKALENGATPKYVNPLLIKALIQDNQGLRAFELLQETPLTNENKSLVYAQTIICLFNLESSSHDKDELAYIREKRVEFAQTLEKFERDALNPHIVKHQALNYLIDTFEYGKAWIYLEELEREKWNGNLKIWRDRVSQAAAMNGVDLDAEVEKAYTGNPDAFPDSDDK